MIGNDIVITVVDIRRDGGVRLGIAAPPEVAVHRREIFERIQRENVAAGRSVVEGLGR